MELAFDSIALRTLCEDQATAGNQLGKEVAELLKRRLADIRAATSIKDLIVGNPRVMDGAENMTISLSDGLGIVIKANHPKNPRGQDGKVDWLRVGRVKILQVGSIDGQTTTIQA